MYKRKLISYEDGGGEEELKKPRKEKSHDRVSLPIRDVPTHW
jgi:hypothetical protein